MARKKLTQLSRVKFEELRQGILDGSLAKEMTGWDERHGGNGPPLSKKQRVKYNQAGALVAIFQSHPDKIRELVRDEQWRQLIIWDDEEAVFLEVRGPRR
jgi:hypothetical protein